MEYKYIWNNIIALCKAHFFLLVFSVLGCTGGIMGISAGAVCGILADHILKRAKDEFLLRHFDSVRNKTQHSSELFAGSIFLSALCTFCLGDAHSAAHLLHSIFAAQYKQATSADWYQLCEHACTGEYTAPDLLCENLAAAIQKHTAEAPIELIFCALHSAEWLWQEEHGMRPSNYLAQLVGYSAKTAAAYKTLGLPPDAPYSAVKKAHRQLAAQFHPDSARSNAEEFRRVQEAFEIISASARY